MMQTEQRYDDLSALFAAQDEALQSDVFVDRVMQPIHKRSRWRTPLLFGAGGLGIGAAVSQMGGLFDAVNARTASLSQALDQIGASRWETSTTDAIWIGAVLFVLVSCAALIATERA